MKLRQHYELSRALKTDFIHPRQRVIFARLSLWQRFFRWISR
jgi:hypothetical protein